MRFKIPFKRSPFMVSIFGIIFSAVVIIFLAGTLLVSNSYANGQTSKNLIDNVPVKSTQIINQTARQAGLPVRLKIPKIKVDTALESVGLTTQGAVGVPKGQSNAAWFNLGPRPGNTGNAVITGHYGIWKNGKSTVFNNLSKLRKGDKLYIKDKNGVTTTFVVRELRTYDQKVDASDVFISSDEKSHLNLITCAGAWNKISQSYPKRLVVFTDKE